MRRVAVVAGGISRFDLPRYENQEEMIAEAVREILNDTPNLSMKDIDTMVASYFSDHFNQQLAQEWTVHDYLGLTPKPVFRIETGGATGGAAFRGAWSLVASGLSDICLVCGWEKMSEVATAKANEFIALASDTDFEFPVGGYYTGYYAAMAVRHMYLYGETEEDLATIAVKNRNNGLDNPYSQWRSQYGKKITVEDVLNSRLIAWPLKILDCCLISDGGAAVVLASEEKAKQLTDTPIWVAGLGLGSDAMRPGDRPDNPGWRERNPELERAYPDYAKKPRQPYPEIANFGACIEAAKRAYRMADLTPNDIDVAEIHDAYDSSELQTYEDLLLCKRGEGKTLIREGQTEIGGKVAVNPSGGLEGMGHPVGATGIAQIVEIFWQLRQEISKKHGTARLQVSNAEVGLAHSHAGTGTTITVNIFSR